MVSVLAVVIAFQIIISTLFRNSFYNSNLIYWKIEETIFYGMVFIWIAFAISKMNVTSTKLILKTLNIQNTKIIIDSKECGNCVVGLMETIDMVYISYIIN